MAYTNTVKDITDKLETGVKELFESEKYANYLKTMSRFHQYSTRNTLLIHLQRPDATRVAGYSSWKRKFNRQVKKGEHGIRIFAPMPFVIKEEQEKLDPVTKKPVIGENGQPVMEEYIKVQSARFKVVSVFDISQTTGEPLPELAETLSGDVERYALFMDALRAISPIPIDFEDLPSDTDGVCRFGEKIAIRRGMSEIQTVSAVIHEITHAKLHDMQVIKNSGDQPKDRRTEEVEAESVAYSVNSFYGIDTGANSFGYIAEWSRGKELKELNASLDTIRKAASELIESIDERYQTLAKERSIDLSTVITAKEKDIQTPDNRKDDDKPGQIYAQYCNIVAKRAGEYMVSSGDMSKNESAARYACDQCVKRVIDDMLLEPGGGHHMRLYDQYMDNPDFKARIEDYAFTKAYLEPINTGREAVISGSLMEAKIDMSLPDPTIGSSETYSYGYTSENMLPLRPGRAVELFDTEHTIYLLYPDNTESMAFDRDEIRNHDGLCGIECNDWERSPVRAAQMEVVNNPKEITEADRFNDDQIADMTILRRSVAKSTQAKRRPSMPKGKPSLLARLDEAKRQVERNKRIETAGNRNERGHE